MPSSRGPGRGGLAAELQRSYPIDRTAPYVFVRSTKCNTFNEKGGHTHSGLAAQPIAY